MTLLGLGVAGGLLPGGAWVDGLKLAAVAVVAHAVWSMARTLTPDLPRAVLALAAAGLALAVPTPFTQVALIVAGALAGLVLLPRLGVDPIAPATRPRGGAVRRLPSRGGARHSASSSYCSSACPLVAEISGSSTVAFVDAFYRAGALVFGGGHVILPLLEASVVEPGWVGPDAFLAGYGAAQAMPGPLFAFAAFLGAAAAGPGAGWDRGRVARPGRDLPAGGRSWSSPCCRPGTRCGHGPRPAGRWPA